MLLASFIIGYLLGSIPFGLLFVRWSGKGDVRHIGSGNIGTTNVLRTGSKFLAIATLLADFGKGLLAVSIFYKLSSESTLPFLAGFGAIIGHIFPIWLKFKGGKGVATALGTYAALNIVLGLGVSCIWLITAKILRISSLSALTAFILAPGISYLTNSFDKQLVYTFLVALIIIWTHRDNIKRLLLGEESTIEL